jgi:alpha/beta superfamily hydrolase
MTTRGLLCALPLLAVCAASVEATGSHEVDFQLRGKTLTLSVYKPARAPIGTIVMGSGDVGWTGLSVTMAEFLSDRGYLVVGVNIRQYLTTFRNGKSHLTVSDPPADYREIAEWLRSEHMLVAPVMMSGVSEGAAIAVLAASDAKNHGWIDGLITMGVPATAELAWKWTDFTTWFTKKDANEPSFSPFDFIGGVAPVPVVMIQSRKDEYVPPADYERCHANAQEPKKLVLIDASNHRFTDRRDQLRQEYLAALSWIQQAKGR